MPVNKIIMEELEPQKSWWSRNWKWVVPVGGCFTLIILVVLGLAGLFFGISSAVTDTSAYTEAMKRTTENEYIIEVLGEPIEKDGFGSTSVNYTNGYKTIEFTTPIKGPKGTATLKVIGEGMDDVWKYSQMDVFIGTEDTIVNLLEDKVLNEDF